jgi:hypothetical protein
LCALYPKNPDTEFNFKKMSKIPKNKSTQIEGGFIFPENQEE